MRLPTALTSLLLSTVAVVTQGRTCLMLYQHADNNLEEFIREDLKELTESTIIRRDDLLVWSYYDGREGPPLPVNTYFDDGYGNVVPGDQKWSQRSRYMKYRNDIGGWFVDTEFPEELNSDSGATIQAFLEHAMRDCLANGYDQFMVIFASHGGGYAGFGGDENDRRKLLQANSVIASAIETALQNAGGPEQLEVLGFDSCLMLALDALDDFASVTKYFLGSEAVEPGHGWAYRYLANAADPLDLAYDIVSTYLWNTQMGSSAHQTPKTLALVDTSLYATFIQAFDNFFYHVNSQLLHDTSLRSYLSRARAASVSFHGVTDSINNAYLSSAADIGSWLANFKSLCQPTGDLGTALDNVIMAYDAMFLIRGNGPGTPAGTGMHITSPAQGDFDSNRNFWQQVLFDNSYYVTKSIPNFREFLTNYFVTPMPEDDYAPVCGADSQPEAATTDAEGLIVEQETLESDDGSFVVSVTMAPRLSEINLQYGLNVTSRLNQELLEAGIEPAEDNELIVLQGDIPGKFGGAKFDAAWDESIFWLNSTDKGVVPIYVSDSGQGSKTIPVMYFSEENQANVSDLQFEEYLFFTADEWKERGAQVGFLVFSTNETTQATNDNLALFTAKPSGGISEEPGSSKGLIVPIIVVEGSIQGRKVHVIPGGGFSRQVVNEWGENPPYNLTRLSATESLSVRSGIDGVLVRLSAANRFRPDVEREDIVYDVLRAEKNAGEGALESSEALWGKPIMNFGFFTSIAASLLLGL